MDDRCAWMLFQEVFGFGTTRGQKALERVGHPSNWFALSPGDREKVLRLTSVEADRLRKATPGRLEKIFKICEDRRCAILTPDDEGYPDRLRQIYAPPAVLYVLGSLEDLDDTLCIAMVGTRHHSDYGRRVAEYIAGDLASAGVTIVSGMAMGIDTICHQAALRAAGRTIAVWGAGIDRPYPAANRDLARSIVEYGGAIVTEFPPGCDAFPYHFPIRNRIISGLCQGTVVVEGAPRSGSLITAGHALTQDRDVFAVPGDVFSGLSQAPNWLISQGAIMARDAGDILAQYGHLLWEDPAAEGKNARPPFDKPSGNGYNVPQGGKKDPAPVQTRLTEGLSDPQRRVYDLLGTEPKSSDELTETSGLGVGLVLATLTQLEIFGLVRVHPGRRFSRK